MLIMASTAPSIASQTTAALVPSLLNNVQAVGFAWMASSALLTTYSTTKYLKYKPVVKEDSIQDINGGSPLSRATLLTLYRFSGSLLLGLIAHPNFHILERFHETLRLVPTFAWPALFLYVANYSNSISLNRIGISLTYTSKCAIPLITVLLTLLLDGATALPSVPVLLTLIPIAGGIAAASWNHPTYERLGMLAAMVSSTAQSALNVSCKRAMTKVGVTGAVAQRAMVAVGLVIALTVSLLQLASLDKDDKTKAAMVRQPPAWLAMMSLTAYHLEYVLSFIFVKMVSPISYGACDAVRRLSIILSGHYMFGGPPFTRMNIMGIGMALLGALSYSMLNAH